jgi:hypothetical protein
VEGEFYRGLYWNSEEFRMKVSRYWNSQKVKGLYSRKVD